MPLANRLRDGGQQRSIQALAARFVEAVSHDKTAPGSSQIHLTRPDRMNSVAVLRNHGIENRCGSECLGVPNHTWFAGKVHAEWRCRSSFEQPPSCFCFRNRLPTKLPVTAGLKFRWDFWSPAGVDRKSSEVTDLDVDPFVRKVGFCPGLELTGDVAAADSAVTVLATSKAWPFEVLCKSVARRCNCSSACKAMVILEPRSKQPPASHCIEANARMRQRFVRFLARTLLSSSPTRPERSGPLHCVRSVPGCRCRCR